MRQGSGTAGRAARHRSAVAGMPTWVLLAALAACGMARGEDLEAMNAAEGLRRELLIEHLERADFSDLVVKDAMTPTPIVVGPEASLPEAARLMVEYDVHHLAVTENRHRFLGVLSSMDILRAVAGEGA